MRIRAHHLLCTQGFQGYGYDENFTNHLKNIIEKFKTQPDTTIQLVSEWDAICVKCPNLMEEKCQMDETSDLRIKKMDKNVLKAIDVPQNAIIKYSAAIEKINDTFKNRSQLENICGNCRWIEVCLWYLSLKM